MKYTGMSAALILGFASSACAEKGLSYDEAVHCTASYFLDLDYANLREHVSSQSGQPSPNLFIWLAVARKRAMEMGADDSAKIKADVDAAGEQIYSYPAELEHRWKYSSPEMKGHPLYINLSQDERRNLEQQMDQDRVTHASAIHKAIDDCNSMLPRTGK